MYVYVNNSHTSNSFTHLNHVCVYVAVVMLFLLPNLLLDVLLLLGKSHCITCMIRKSPWGTSLHFSCSHTRAFLMMFVVFLGKMNPALLYVVGGLWGLASISLPTLRAW
jgi:hypothetical protein